MVDKTRENGEEGKGADGAAVRDKEQGSPELLLLFRWNLTLIGGRPLVVTEFKLIE